MRVSIVCLLLSPLFAPAQSNIVCTNSLAEQIMLGHYDPAPFAAATPADPSELARDLEAEVSPDTLKTLIIKLATFGTRNSGSDTVSDVRGIGAARRWAFSKFQQYSAQSNGRLIPAYLEFDSTMCSIKHHSDVLAILPGSDPSSGCILVEGHMDSRCAVLCDTACVAQGVEDNATGTALVMELARVLSRWQFNNTIVFMITTGEEQGLIGARAFASYATLKQLKLRAVLNNDVIGGIICGKTSSPPSCPGLNDIDSTSVRLFSSGGFNSKHKQLARFIKLQYEENLLPTTSVPMLVRIMTPEDRTNRGGDHIPFRQMGFAAMRFTAANEHGDASNGAGYTDRQHTSSDILGIDKNMDGSVDSFYVDFNYLARNTVINGIGACIAARNVALPPDFTPLRSGSNLRVDFAQPLDTQTVRIAVRSLTHDWDTVYTVSPAHADDLYCNATGNVYVSVAGVDAFGAESLFSVEKIAGASATEEASEVEQKAIELLQNKPNPFDEATWICFNVNKMPQKAKKAFILISDLAGRTVQTLPVQLQPGYNEVMYSHGYGVRGTFSYSLVIDGRVIETRQMIFAN